MGYSALQLVLALASHAGLHVGAVPFLRGVLPRRYASRLDALEPYQCIKLARLIRSTVYDTFAVCCGTLLLWRCQSFRDLSHLCDAPQTQNKGLRHVTVSLPLQSLTPFHSLHPPDTPLHMLAFNVALAHWIVSLCEDYAATSRSFELRFAGSTQPRMAVDALQRRTHEALHVGCLLHHAIAAGAYALCLSTHLLGGMGAVGLLYEGPVLFMNAREALVDLEEPLGWLAALGGPQPILTIIALGLHNAFVPCRFGGDLLYLYCVVCRYDEVFATLPLHVRALCHCVAPSFILLNCTGYPFLCRQTREDIGVPSDEQPGLVGGASHSTSRMNLVDGADDAQDPPPQLHHQLLENHPSTSTRPLPPRPPDSYLPMRTYVWWRVAWLFTALEAGCLVWKHTTLMSVVTSGYYGVVERSLLMRMHVGCATLMWALGMIQLLNKRLRATRPRLHRALGVVFLLDWAFVVGPTSLTSRLNRACPTLSPPNPKLQSLRRMPRVDSSFYLSLSIQGDSLFGTLASVVLCDVTLLSYYFFWRAWRVARERRQGDHSLALHGNLMGMGIVTTWPVGT